MMISYTVLLAVLIPLSIIAISYIALHWRRVVPTNMVHIVQTATKSISYGPGKPAGNTYYEFPAWMPVIGVLVSKFPESVFSINLMGYESYDVGRLPFVIDVTAFYRISDSQMAANRVASFQELQGQLERVLQGSCRRILATNTLEHIMQARSELAKEFTTEVDHQLKEWGVATVKMIEFMDIRDHNGAQVIANMMAKEKSRIEKESRVAVAANMQEAETKEIEAKRQVALSKTEAEQQVGIREAEREQTVGIAREKANQQVQSEAKTTAEKLMEVRKVQEVKQAEITREVQNVQADMARNVQVVKAEADKQSAIHVAEGNLQSTLKNAEGVEALGAAKASAEAALLLAPVTAQLTLAKEIGENEGYQNYLVNIRKVESAQAVGIEMAQAMKEADMKIIANAGDVQSGLGSLTDVFTPKGGTSIAGMLSAMAQTEEGKAVIEKVTGAITPKVKK